MKRKISLPLFVALGALHLTVTHSKAVDPLLDIDFRKDIPAETSGKVKTAIEPFEKGKSEPVFQEGEGGGMVTFTPTAWLGGGLRVRGVEGPLALAEQEDEISVAAWVKLAASPNKGKQTVVGNLDDTEQSGWIFGVYPDGSLFFYWTRPEAAATLRKTLQVSPEGEWHHIAMVWKNSEDKGLSFYVDGLPVEPLSGDGRVVYSKGSTPIPLGDAPITVGATTNGRFPFPGSIRDIKLFDQALSAEEVFQLSQVGAGAQ